MGQNLAAYPMNQRMQQLNRTYQLQNLGQSMGNNTLGRIGRAAGSLLLGVPLTQPNPLMVPQPYQAPYSQQLFPYGQVMPNQFGY
jgi:hypothetical protein